MFPIQSLGKTLIGFGILLMVVGVLLLLLSRVGVTRLPGDIAVRGKNWSFFFPLGWSILISIVLTLALNVWMRRGR